MLQRNCVLIAVVGSCIAIANPAMAQSLPTFTPQQLNRLSRDLTPFNSQDFFRQGRSQLEQEVQRLERVQSRNSNPLLKIDPATQSPNPDPIEKSAKADRRNSSKPK